MAREQMLLTLTVVGMRTIGQMMKEEVKSSLPISFADIEPRPRGDAKYRLLGSLMPATNPHWSQG